jgi:hypothetical protein
MLSALSGHGLQHWLAGAILLSRLGDVGSTYLATPKLALESNPIAKRLGWPFAWLTLLVCLVAYVDVGTGIAVLVMSLLVTGSNLSKAWAMRTLGEAGYQEHMVRLVRASSLHAAVGFTLGSALCVGLVGALLGFASSVDSVAYWVGVGVVLYALAVAIYGSISVTHLFRRVRQEERTALIA